ncbi:42240_t:CDS:2, partial [Gigaspora margarita]
LNHFNYGIKEQLKKETSSKQMAIDVEITKMNLPKAPIELDIYGSQNESEKGDYSPKRSETTHLIVQELPKSLIPHRKGNDMINLALMEIVPNKASNESNIEINPMQEVKIIVPAKQTLANQLTPSRLTVKSFKANSKSKAAFVEIEFKNEKQGKGIVTSSNAIKIINKRSFSSLEDNRDINLQKVILERTKHESLKEQNRKTSRESDESTIVLLTGTPVVYESVDEPVGSSSRVPSVDTNRKGLLQKKLTLKIDKVIKEITNIYGKRNK